MNKPNKTTQLTVLAATLATCLTSASARADGLNVQTMVPATNSSYVLTEDALLETTPKDKEWKGRRWFFAAQYNWLNDPLVAENSKRTVRTGLLVDSVHTLDLGVGVFLDQRLALALDAPLNIVRMPGIGDQFGLADARILAKWRVTPNNALVALSLIPEITLPNGDGGLFLSSGSVGLGVRLAVERDFGDIRAAANIGFRRNPGAILQNIDYRSMLPMSLGAMYLIDDKWALNAEASGALALPISRFNNPGELYLGARNQITRETSVHAGLSVGALSDQASADVRLVLGVKFSPSPEPVAPPKVETRPVVQQAPVQQQPVQNYYKKTVKKVTQVKQAQRQASQKVQQKSQTRKAVVAKAVQPKRVAKKSAPVVRRAAKVARRHQGASHEASAANSYESVTEEIVQEVRGGGAPAVAQPVAPATGVPAPKAPGT